MRWLAYKIFRAIFKAFFKIFFGIKIHGVKNIPKRGGFILASNHASFLDPIVVGIGSPRPVHFLARNDLFSNRFLGPLLRSWQVIPLARYGGDIGAIKEAIKNIRQEGGVAIFPEGTRSQDGKLTEFKLGVGLLAAKTGAPVVPVMVKGSDAALPRSAKFIRPHRIEVYFRRPIMVSEIVNSMQGPRALYAEINKKILEGLTRFSRHGGIPQSEARAGRID